MLDTNAATGSIDIGLRSLQAALEKVNKQLDTQVTELNAKLADAQKETADVVRARDRLQAETVESARRLADVESQLGQLHRVRQALSAQLEETKTAAEDDARVRQKLTMDNRNLQAVVEQLKEQVEETAEARADVQRQLTRALNDVAAARQKAEAAEEGIRPEELEDVKRKLAGRIQDGEAQLEAALSKAMTMEKMKTRLQMELEAVITDLEKVS